MAGDESVYTGAMVQTIEKNEGKYYDGKNEKNNVRVLVR